MGISERTLERILAQEPDEIRAQEAIDRFLQIKEDLNRYIAEHYKPVVPGGRYWEPGAEENPPLPRDQWLDVEPEDLPFE